MALLCEGKRAHLQISGEAAGLAGRPCFYSWQTQLSFRLPVTGSLAEGGGNPTLKEELRAGSAGHRRLVEGGWTVRLAY